MIIIPSVHLVTSTKMKDSEIMSPHKPLPGLTFITLNYLQPKNAVNINHNCRLITNFSRRTAPVLHEAHRFIVYTDNMTSPYCRLCECREYKPYNCPCPGEEKNLCAVRNACEKLLFIEEMVASFEEFAYLDNDLIILQPVFLENLYHRSRQHDFLASYGHDMTKKSTYRGNFNSGLFFMRRIPALNYTEMRSKMYEWRSIKDQSIVSWFVHKYYKNWDSLSYKWHCRFLIREKQEIPFEDCYTLHDKMEVEDILKKMNRTRLVI